MSCDVRATSQLIYIPGPLSLPVCSSILVLTSFAYCRIWRGFGNLIVLTSFVPASGNLFSLLIWDDKAGLVKEYSEFIDVEAEQNGKVFLFSNITVFYRDDQADLACIFRIRVSRALPFPVDSQPHHPNTICQAFNSNIEHSISCRYKSSRITKPPFTHTTPQLLFASSRLPDLTSAPLCRSGPH